MRFLPALIVLLSFATARAEVAWLDSLDYAGQVKRYDFYQSAGPVTGYIRTSTDPFFDTAVTGYLFSGTQGKLLAVVPRNTSFSVDGPGGWYQIAVTGTPTPDNGPYRVRGAYEINVQSDASATPIVPEPVGLAGVGLLVWAVGRRQIKTATL